MKSQRPTRRDLLLVILRLQRLVGDAHGSHGNDRDAYGFQKGQESLKRAENLCHLALGFDPPMDGAKSRNGWEGTET